MLYIALQIAIFYSIILDEKLSEKVFIWQKISGILQLF